MLDPRLSAPEVMNESIILCMGRYIIILSFPSLHHWRYSSCPLTKLALGLAAKPFQIMSMVTCGGLVTANERESEVAVVHSAFQEVILL